MNNHISLCLQRDVTKIEKTTEEMVDRLRALRTAVFRANEKMDQFRLLMHWNQVGVQNALGLNNCWVCTTEGCQLLKDQVTSRALVQLD